MSPDLKAAIGQLRICIEAATVCIESMVGKLPPKSISDARAKLEHLIPDLDYEATEYEIAKEQRRDALSEADCGDEHRGVA